MGALHDNLKLDPPEPAEHRAAEFFAAAAHGRRGFLVRGFLGTAALAVSGIIPRSAKGRTNDGEPGLFFSVEHAAIFSAVFPVILGGLFPAHPAMRKQSITVALDGADRYLAKMPHYAQAEAKDVLDLLDFSVVRVLAGGFWSDWGETGEAEIAKFLNNLRTSRIGLKRQIYQFLHEMSAVAWYGNPASWAAIGYPGPPKVARPEPTVRT